MADLVTRLRDRFQCACGANVEPNWDETHPLWKAWEPCSRCADRLQAADEIERLRAEVARLGSFLHPIGEKARRG